MMSRSARVAAPLILMALLMACSATSTSPAPPPTAAGEPPATGRPASPVVPSPRPTPVPSVPTPMPSPVASADLLIRLDVCADVCIDPRRIEYLADGRVVRLDEQSGRLVERRLSSAALARVGARVAGDADLLVRTMNVDPVLVSSRTPPGHGVITYAFTGPATSGGPTRVRTVTAPSLDAGYWRPDPRIDRLTALGDALLDPEGLAGPDGWADPAWVPYAPAKVAVFVHVRDGVVPFSSPDLGAAGWPFPGGDPRTFGEAFASPMDAWPTARCAVLDAAAADAAAAALPPGTLSPDGPPEFWSGGSAAWAQRGLELQVSMRVLLPDQESQPCGDLWTYG